MSSKGSSGSNACKKRSVICQFFSTPAGCKTGNECRFIHQETGNPKRARDTISLDSNLPGNNGNSSDEMIMESFDVPRDNVKLIVGRKGTTINRLSREFGEAFIKIPDPEEQGTDGMVSVTITSRRKSFVRILQAIFTIFNDAGRDTTFLRDALNRYGVVTRRRKSLLSPPHNNANNDPLMLENLPQSSRGPAPPIALMDVRVPEASFGRQECEEISVVHSGWGPLVDRHFKDNGPQQNESNIHDNYFMDQQDEIGEQQHLDFPSHPAHHTPNIDNSIQEKSGFIYLSQHVVTENYVPGENEHKLTLSVKAGEIVTFNKRCDCCRSCGYGSLRNAVGMVGYIPMNIISEDILKFECPYCDDVHQFYQENDYLKHMCNVHFWRRLSGFLNQTAPFNCPFKKSCNYKGRTFEELVFHYGAMPHKKVGALILDSVGERVKDLKKTSTISKDQTNLRQISKDQTNLRQELEKSQSVIRGLQQTLQDQNRSNPDLQFFQDKIKAQSSEKQILEAKCIGLEQRLAAYKDLEKANEQSNRRIKKLEDELSEKETAIKQLQEAIKQKKEKISSQENIIRHHEKYIRDLEAKQKSRVENPVITLDEDQERVTELSSQLEVLKKEAKDKENTLSQMRADMKSLKSKLAEAQQQASSADVQVVLPLSEDAKDATIEKLRKLVKSQKAMLALKQQEIDLYKDQVNEEL